MKLSSRVPSLWGCLSERLNCPAVTTEISISLTHTRSAHSALLCACLCLESAFMAKRVRVRIDTREILDLWWHWSSGVQPGRRFSLRGVWLQIAAPSSSSSAQQGASFTSSVLAMSSLDNCKQREFLYLSLTYQAADSAEIVSPGDDYPNKRSFKLLLAAEAVVYWLYYSLCVWDKMTLNFVAMILIPILRYRAAIRLKLGPDARRAFVTTYWQNLCLKMKQIDFHSVSITWLSFHLLGPKNPSCHCACMRIHLVKVSLWCILTFCFVPKSKI